MMKKLGEFLLAKDAHAVIIAFFCALLSVFNFPTGFIAAIIVGLITLQKGALSGLKLLAWVALPTIALLVLRQVGEFDFLLLRCILIWIFSIVLSRYRAWNILLEGIALIGVVLIALLHFWIPGLQAWWSQELVKFIQPLIAESHWKLAITPTEFADKLAPIATGVMAFFLMSGVLLELLIARFWQSLVVNPGEFLQEFTRIRIGRITAVILLMLVAASLFKMHASYNHVIYDVAPLMLLPFFAAGLSMLHFWVHQKKQLIFLLILVYVSLFFLPAFVISILALIAFVDTWCDFRKKVVSEVKANRF